MSFKREKADSTGEWEVDVQRWGTGGGQGGLGSFWGRWTSLLADGSPAAAQGGPGPSEGLLRPP